MNNWYKRLVARYRKVIKRAPEKIPVPWQIVVSMANFAENASDLEVYRALCRLLKGPIPYDRNTCRQIVEFLQRPGETESDDDIATAIFRRICKHPSSTDLIYWPAETPFGPDDLTVDQIVEICSLDPPASKGKSTDE